jgi:hypothetical protein
MHANAAGADADSHALCLRGRSHRSDSHQRHDGDAQYDQFPHRNPPQLGFSAEDQRNPSQ